jgi:hypothetical protein
VLTPDASEIVTFKAEHQMNFTKSTLVSRMALFMDPAGKDASEFRLSPSNFVRNTDYVLALRGNRHEHENTPQKTYKTSWRKATGNKTSDEGSTVSHVVHAVIKHS